jgi:hypothetical protein
MLLNGNVRGMYYIKLQDVLQEITNWLPVWFEEPGLGASDISEDEAIRKLGENKDLRRALRRIGSLLSKASRLEQLNEDCWKSYRGLKGLFGL